jgi:hypothetical protein
MSAACSSTLAASGPNRGFVDDDAERRFQGMSEIADLGARAFHHVAVGVNQQIEFAGKRREILREIAFDFLGFTASYRGDPFLQLPKRFQAVPKLRRRRHNKGQREYREGEHEVKLESRNLGLDFLGRRGDLNEINSLISSIDDATDGRLRLQSEPRQAVQRRCL